MRGSLNTVLQSIISGGQTGADQGGLKAALYCGVTTGGLAPKGFKTESGPNPWLLSYVYGLEEDDSDAYPPRTRKNIEKAAGTVVFSSLVKNGSLVLPQARSRGTDLTIRIAREVGKPLIINPCAAELRSWIIDENIWCMNVAGPRESVLPGIEEHVFKVVANAIGLVRWEYASAHANGLQEYMALRSQSGLPE